MNAVRQQRSTDVTYTVNETVLEHRKFVDQEDGGSVAICRLSSCSKTKDDDH